MRNAKSRPAGAGKEVRREFGVGKTRRQTKFTHGRGGGNRGQGGACGDLGSKSSSRCQARDTQHTVGRCRRSLCSSLASWPIPLPRCPRALGPLSVAQRVRPSPLLHRLGRASLPHPHPPPPVQLPQPKVPYCGSRQRRRVAQPGCTERSPQLPHEGSGGKAPPAEPGRPRGCRARAQAAARPHQEGLRVE